MANLRKIWWFASVAAALMAQGDLRTIKPVNTARRAALVIGNSAYRNRPLVNPSNDARDVGARLKELGFDTDVVLDAGRKQMAEGIDRFLDKLRTGDVALFYYSGHGMQIDGENYLIPVDFAGQNETDVRYDTQAAGRIQERMERSGAQLNIIILDACRDNPYRSSSRSAAGGLAAMSAGRGTFVAFATAPGRTASDNSGGRNGLFTQYFLEALKQPGLGLDDVFNAVRERVDQSSGGKQLPWTQSAVVGRFTFVEAGSASTSKADPNKLEPNKRTAGPAKSRIEGTWTASGEKNARFTTTNHRYHQKWTSSLQISRSVDGFTALLHEEREDKGIDDPKGASDNFTRRFDATFRLRLDGDRLSGASESARFVDLPGGHKLEFTAIQFTGTLVAPDRLEINVVWQRDAQGKEITWSGATLEKRP